MKRVLCRAVQVVVMAPLVAEVLAVMWCVWLWLSWPKQGPELPYLVGLLGAMWGGAAFVMLFRWPLTACIGAFVMSAMWAACPFEWFHHHPMHRLFFDRHGLVVVLAVALFIWGFAAHTWLHVMWQQPALPLMPLPVARPEPVAGEQAEVTARAPRVPFWRRTAKEVADTAPSNVLDFAAEKRRRGRNG